MDGEICNILLQNMSQPVAPFVEAAIPQASFDTDRQAAFFSTRDQGGCEVGVFDKSSACFVFNNIFCWTAHIDIDTLVSHVSKASRHVCKLVRFIAPDLRDHRL